MLLRVLGSGTVAPSATRSGPAYWVEAGPVRLLMDCGAGALHRAASFGVPWHTVSHAALTHFHVDHWGELPHLLFALRWGIEPPRETPLTLLGPVGLVERLQGVARAFGDWVRDPGYPLTVREIDPTHTVELATDVSLAACRTPHTDESLAFAVRHAGARLVYTGDTGPSADLARWAMDCDLLLAECSLPDDRAIGIHLTPTQAGELARDARVRRLVLTHFYPPVERVDAAALAARVFRGDVVAARDGDRFIIEAE